MNKKELFHIAEDFFQQQGWTAFPFQKKTWDAFLAGKHGLLNAPTGSGKTYALWVAIVLNYIKNNPDYKTKPTKGLKAIWITPLRSLSNEIEQTSQRFVDGIGLPFTVGIRSGDTPTKERAAQIKNMPDLLITTPESLHLLLASKDHQKFFGNLNAIVVDEWHELLGTKRGVQMELGISRLLGLSKQLRVWGISATIGNLEQARQVLLGVDEDRFRESVLIKANLKKEIEVKSIIPESMDKFPWRGHLGLHLMKEVVEIINSSKSTLIFTNTRAQCELWFQGLMTNFPELCSLNAFRNHAFQFLGRSRSRTQQSRRTSIRRIDAQKERQSIPRGS